MSTTGLTTLKANKLCLRREDGTWLEVDATNILTGGGSYPSHAEFDSVGVGTPASLTNGRLDVDAIDCRAIQLGVGAGVDLQSWLEDLLQINNFDATFDSRFLTVLLDPSGWNGTSFDQYVKDRFNAQSSPLYEIFVSTEAFPVIFDAHFATLFPILFDVRFPTLMASYVLGTEFAAAVNAHAIPADRKSVV